MDKINSFFGEYSNIEPTIIWAGVFLCFVLFILLISKRKAFKKGAFYPRGCLLTKAELYFYNALKKALGNNKYMICFKVRLADVVDCSRTVWKSGGYKISGKHVDFVLIDPKTTKILCAIELDDKSHRQEDRIERDVFVNNVMSNAGVPLLRFPVKRKYSQLEIKNAISMAMS